MRNLLFYFLFIVSITSCLSRKIISPVEDKKEYNGKLFFATYDEKKYPRDTINTGPNDSLRIFTNKWYSKHLNSLEETPLYDRKDKNLKIIRYTNLGTWSHPFVYRMENIGNQVTVTYNESDGLGGYQTGKLIKNYSKKINPKKWEAIISKANHINFWDMKTHKNKNIKDGEEWIFEILIDGKYHLVTRNSPQDFDDKEFAELCNSLIN